MIKRNFTIGRQHDAHEYFLALIDNMQTSILKIKKHQKYIIIL